MIVGIPIRRVLVAASVAAIIAWPATVLAAGRSFMSPDTFSQKNPILYVADGNNNAVDLFNAKNLNSPMLGSITDGISNPGAIAVDGNGTLYVANQNTANITVYESGRTKPSRTITVKNGTPYALGVGADGTLAAGFESQQGSAELAIFGKGNHQPTREIAVPLLGNSSAAIVAVSVDRAGAVYASVNRYPSGPSQLLKVSPGSKNLVDTGLTPGDGQGFDFANNLYVGYWYSLSVYPTGKNQGYTITNGLYLSGFFTVAPDGTLFVPNMEHRVCGQNVYGNVVEYAPGGTSPIATLSAVENPVATAVRAGRT